MVLKILVPFTWRFNFFIRDTTFDLKVGMTENCEYEIPMFYVWLFLYIC